jgi:hypothetical protein
MIDWLRYFLANAAEPELPWDCGYRLTGAERAAVLPSIQQFQLGEGARGRRLLERARAAARQPEDMEYVEALGLFIREEQRHSRMLGRFLAVEGVGCLHRHWIDGVFRWVRAVAGLELFLRVLATAEVIAIPYYTALRDSTGSPLLGAICSRILREEAAHLRFQASTLARLEHRRRGIARRLARTLHRWFLIATTALVWVEHRFVFGAGGYSHARLRTHALAEYEALWRR